MKAPLRKTPNCARNLLDANAEQARDSARNYVARPNSDCALHAGSDGALRLAADASAEMLKSLIERVQRIRLGDCPS
jgi:hypothetical protein